MASAFVPFVDTMQANVLMTLNGQQIENTLYFSFPDLTFVAAAAIVGPILKTQLVTPMATHQSNRLTYRGIHMVDLTADDAGVADYTTGFPIVGGNDAQPIPNGTALVLTARTANRGRSARGRNYIAGLLDSQMTDSVYQSGIVTACLVIYNDVVDSAASSGTPNVVASRFHNGVAREVGQSLLVTLWDNVQRGSRSQRRRNPGVGV